MSTTDAQIHRTTEAGEQHTERRGLLHRGWRKMTWAIIAYSTFIVLVGLIETGKTVARVNAECKASVLEKICSEAGNHAAGEQFWHIIGKFGLGGCAVLAVIWFMTRPEQPREI
jgi:hypothetical protein